MNKPLPQLLGGKSTIAGTFTGCLFVLLACGCANQQQQQPYPYNCNPYGAPGYAVNPYAQQPYQAVPYGQPAGLQPITPSPAVSVPMTPGVPNQMQYPVQGYPQQGANIPQPFVGS